MDGSPFVICICTDPPSIKQILPALWLEAAATELWAAGKEFQRGQVSRGANASRLYLSSCFGLPILTCTRAYMGTQTVGDRVGKNEKTKLVAKLQPAVGWGFESAGWPRFADPRVPCQLIAIHAQGQGPPAREPVVSEAERTAMLAYYFKRQEELKVWMYVHVRAHPLEPTTSAAAI